MVFTKQFWEERRSKLIKKLKIGAKNRKNPSHAIPHTKKTKKTISEKIKELYREGKIESPFKNMTYEQRLKQVRTRKERNHYNRTPEQNMKLSNSVKGEKHYGWIKDRSFLIYPDEFNNGLKQKIKKNFRFRCQECFRHQNELEHSLSVHHIDFNKKNNSENNLIPLCKSCHTQTNFNRENWTTYFQERINGIA